jgi:hypothetical protein
MEQAGLMKKSSPPNSVGCAAAHTLFGTSAKQSAHI